MTSTSAKQPVAAPAAVFVGILAAVSVIAVGVMGIRDTLITTDAITGTPWLPWLLEKAEVLKPVDWMIPAGIAAVVVGLCVLVMAFKPRRATHLALGDGTTGVWLRRGDTARMAADTAQAVDSVTAALTKAKGRSVLITATATGDMARVRDDLTTSIGQRLQAVTPTPRIRTRVRLEEY